MKRVNLLVAVATVCGLGALLLEVVSTRTFGIDAVLILLILLTVAALSMSLRVTIRGERQHRWALSRRVTNLENELTLRRQEPSVNAELSGKLSSAGSKKFVDDSYPALAPIYDRIHALESERNQAR